MKRDSSWWLLITGGVLLMTLALVGDGRLWGQKAEGDEELSFAASYAVFTLEAGGEPMGNFTSCSGLGMSNEIDYQNLTLAPGIPAVQASAGYLKECAVTLRSEEPGAMALWQWRKAMDVAGYRTVFREGRINMYDSTLSQPVATWVFRKGWPATVMFNEGKLEVVIAHEGLEMVIPGGGPTVPKGKTR